MENTSSCTGVYDVIDDKSHDYEVIAMKTNKIKPPSTHKDGYNLNQCPAYVATSLHTT